jgi:hypothetical protein
MLCMRRFTYASLEVPRAPQVNSVMMADQPRVSRAEAKRNELDGLICSIITGVDLSYDGRGCI